MTLVRSHRPGALATLALLLAALSSPLHAQSTPPPWTLAGRVLDASGAAVPGATVAAVNTATGLERLATSDANGQFAVSGLTGRVYRVTASLPGFEAARLDAVESSTAPLTLVLKPAARIEQVTVVSASRVEERRTTLNTRVDVISRARLDATARASVGDVLREVPGVVSRRGSEGTTAAGEQIQGLDSRQVAVLIDGQPVVGARGIKSGIVNLDRQPTDQLDRIEVVKGASSALFGSDAIGGAINLITRQPESAVEIAASGSAGAFGGRDAGISAGARRDRLSFYAAAGRHERDSFDLTPETPDTTGSALTRSTGYGRFMTRLSPSLQIQATGTGYWNAQAGRFIGETGLQDSDVRDRATGGHVSADWQLARRTSLQLRAYGSRYREDSVGRPIDAQERDEIGRLRESLFKSDATVGHLLGERQYLQAGVEWWSDHYDGINRLRDDAGHDATTSVVWLQDRIHLLERATVTAGARYDRHSVFGSELSPKIGANVRAADGLHLRVSYGEGFRAPDLGQLYYRFVPSANIYQVLGNPSLLPETSRSWQYGADWSVPGGRARIGVNGFRNEADDLIVAESLGFLTSPGQLQSLIDSGRVDPSFSPVFGRLLLAYRNVSNVTTQGVELDGEVVLGRGLSAAAAYTYLDAIDRTTGLEIPGRHRHQGFARVSWTPSTSPFRGELRGAFYGSWLATTEDRAPAFALWDVIAASRVRPGVEIFAAIDNVFDSQDPNTSDAIYRPEIGRTWRTGVRWAWRQR
jgi:outer membrane receptor for ferrienterochelin and colicins